MVRSVVLASFVLAVLSACAGSEPAGVSDPPSTVATTTSAATATTSGPDEMRIADILRSDARFSRFRSLMERTETRIAGSVLAVWDWPAERMGDNRDGVTLFVPTDAAFASLDPAILEVIDDPEVDNQILYDLFGLHYVHRLYPRAEFEAGDQATWIRNPSGPVQLRLDPLTWGGHPIEQTDIRASNGFIHAIGGVVIPDELAEAAGVNG